MASINRELQERVWQRVRGEEPQTSHQEGPEGLLLAELTDGRLMGQLGSGELLRQLQRQTAERAEALRGMCMLMEVTPPQIPQTAVPAPEAAAHRRLMGNFLRRSGEYRRLSGASEYGAVYGRLADSLEDSCLLLARYIGTAHLHNRRK